jgi:signal transduction histidine kinase
MKQFSFKNRIAFNYILTTALLIFAVFFAIYSMVKFTINYRVNNEIRHEAKKHLKEIEVIENCVLLIREKQWKQKQINRVDVSPAFIQFVDDLGALVEKSPNLKAKQLNFYPNQKSNELFDAKLDNISVRQIQVPLYQGTKIIGYMIVATSLEESVMILGNLFKVMLVAYPLILLVLFLIARFFAGNSIKPIRSIIETSNFITKDNLKLRIPLPQNKDELHLLSTTINSLLDRLENAVDREKQFTSDASHELRTPLAVIKGTLEVLVRKPRKPEEYKEKIDFCISEVDRLNTLVDQLLLLARFENQKQTLNITSVNLEAIILECISRSTNELENKKISVKTHFETNSIVQSDVYLLSIIFNNLISNAIKYSFDKTTIFIDTEFDSQSICLKIRNKGEKIPSAELENIFKQFYRVNPNNPDIKGTGLGLSIVKKLCDLLNVDIIAKTENDETVFLLIFK